MRSSYTHIACYVYIFANHCGQACSDRVRREMTATSIRHKSMDDVVCDNAQIDAHAHVHRHDDQTWHYAVKPRLELKGSVLNCEGAVTRGVAGLLEGKVSSANKIHNTH